MNKIKKEYITTSLDFCKFINTLDKKYAFDTETTSLKYKEMKIEGFSICDSKQACYVNLVDNPDASNLLFHLNALITERTKVLICHNIKFDMKVLKSVGIIVPEEVNLFDTMIAHHLLDENSKHGLKVLAKEILGEEEIMTYEEARAFGADSQEFINYATNDAIWTLRLAAEFIPRLREEELVQLFTKIEMPFQRCLVDMETNGMLIDTELVHKKAEELKVSIAELDDELRRFAGVDEKFNFNSSKQLGELLFDKMNLPVIEQTPSGKPSTGKFTIERLAKDNPFVDKLQTYKIAQKLYTSYFSEKSQILTNLDEDNRVRPNFNDMGTVTGRLSCSQPNLQQLPKNNKKLPISPRECFIVPEGKIMITCDFSGQEVAVAAQQSKDETLIDALNKGQDMHLRIANQFYELGIPDECLYKTHQDYEKYKERFSKERSRAKTITFGLMYGKGAYGFAKDFNISEGEAQAIVDKYFSGMPMLRESIDVAHDSIKKNGFVRSMAGRKRRFKPVERYGKIMYQGRDFRQAFNFLIQGFSADMMRKAMIAVRKEAMKHPEYGINIIGTCHDEIITECNFEYEEQASKLIKEQMESCVNFVVPINADIGKGFDYEEAK